MKRSLVGGLAVAILTLSLVGCGSLPGISHQGDAGIFNGEVDVGTLVKDKEVPYIKHVSIVSGKEVESLTADITFDDMGKPVVKVTANGVKAFDGQKARAAVEQAISSDAKDAMPGIVDSVMNAVKSYLGAP